MKIDEFEFRNEKGKEIEPTKAQLVVYIKALHKEIKKLENAYKMACEEFGKVEVFDKEFMECESFYDYFKTKAKGE